MNLNSLNKKKCFFWITDTDKILSGEKPAIAIGGANLQMALWAKCFAENGWKTYSFTDKISRTHKFFFGIQYLFFPLVRYVMFVLIYFRVLWLFIIRPDIVFTRGYPLDSKLLLFLSKILKYKLVHMLASDADVKLEDNEEKNKLQEYISKVKYVIAQNNSQKHFYNKFFRKTDIPVIPNIWDESVFRNFSSANTVYDAIWIGNIKTLKRPEWFINIGKELKGYKFALIGANQDNRLFKICMDLAAENDNIDMLGYKSLHEVDQVLSNSKLLICTSEFEGFPNTFLHAWSKGIPVISTVDPNESITNCNLGFFSENYSDIKKYIELLLSDPELYSQIQVNIKKYFLKSHNPSTHLKTLIDFTNQNV